MAAFGDVQGNVPMPVADHKAIVGAEVVVYLGKDIVSGGARVVPVLAVREELVGVG
jgi:hypothetical protein